MPKPILIDTAFIIALVNQRYQFHAQARELASRYGGHPFLVTEAVLLEIGNALSRGFKKEAIRIIEMLLDDGEVEIVHLSPKLFDQAFALYKKYRNKEWSLVDCVSFVVMQEAGIEQALTFDQHFAQAGFQVLAN